MKDRWRMQIMSRKAFRGEKLDRISGRNVILQKCDALVMNALVWENEIMM